MKDGELTLFVVGNTWVPGPLALRHINGNHKLIKFTKLLNVFKLLNIIIVIIKMYLSYL